MNPSTLQSPHPGVMAPFVGATEPVGGVLLLVGLATPPVASRWSSTPGRYSVDAVSGLSRQLTQRIARRFSAGAAV